MPECPRCHRLLADAARFCGACGAQVDAGPPAASPAGAGTAPETPLLPDAASGPRAPGYGSAAQSRCPNCGQPLGAGAAGCARCGVSFTQSADTEAAQPEEPPRCALCGAPLKEGASFCGSCGAAAAASVAAPVVLLATGVLRPPSPATPPPVQPPPGPGGSGSSPAGGGTANAGGGGSSPGGGASSGAGGAPSPGGGGTSYAGGGGASPGGGGVASSGAGGAGVASSGAGGAGVASSGAGGAGAAGGTAGKGLLAGLAAGTGLKITVAILIAIIAVGTTVGVVRLVNRSTPPPPTPIHSPSATSSPTQSPMVETEAAEPAPVITGVAPYGYGAIMEQEQYVNSWGSVYAELEDNGVSVDPARCELWIDGQRWSVSEVLIESDNAGSPVVRFVPIDAISYVSPHDVEVIIVSSDGQRATYAWTGGGEQG